MRFLDCLKSGNIEYEFVEYFLAFGNIYIILKGHSLSLGQYSTSPLHFFKIL